MIPLIEIGKCCDVISGSTPSRRIAEYWNGDINWFTPKDLSKLENKYIYDAPEKITKIGYDSCSTRMLPAMSLLFTSRAPIGHLAITKKEACTNQGFKSLIPNKNLDVEYLYYVMLNYTPNLQDLGNGATFKELSKSTISAFKIPLPPLPEQKKIAAILDAADAYRQKTKALIEKYDALTQSLFLDMFGDPVTNPKGWEETIMSEACSKVTDGTHDTPKRIKEGKKFITGKHIRPYKIDYDNSDYVAEEVHQEIYRRCNPEIGDILYTNIGVNLGTAALNKVQYEFSMKNVALLKPISSIITGRYIEYFLNSQNMKAKIVWIASLGGAQQFLSLTELRRLKVNLPPIDLQNQFAEHVQKIEAQKAKAQASLEKAETLFNSLLQRAFKGELTH